MKPSSFLVLPLAAVATAQVSSLLLPLTSPHSTSNPAPTLKLTKQTTTQFNIVPAGSNHDSRAVIRQDQRVYPRASNTAKAATGAATGAAGAKATGAGGAAKTTGGGAKATGGAGGAGSTSKSSSSSTSAAAAKATSPSSTAAAGAAKATSSGASNGTVSTSGAAGNAVRFDALGSGMVTIAGVALGMAVML